MFTKNAKVEMLKRVPLFSDCSRRELNEVAMIADEIYFPAGTALMKEGDAGKELVVVVDGTVEISRRGKRVPPKGDTSFFGEASLLTGTPRNATVTTTSPVRALVITARSFGRLLTDSPGIQRKILVSLASRLPDAS
ncbi:MAG TPA: cyclic nucleotide-binding domain-containing protein [Gaiellaceae bacterium]|nr:cyclic nucleotide-binding domain-containing protein [Gaiellaceae bacterium]